MILEEFGLQDHSTRDGVYQTWTEAVRTGGGDGFTFWILTGIQDDGSLYPDYDGFRVTYPSTTATVLSNAADDIGGAPEPTPTVTGSPTSSPTTSPTTSATNSPSTPPPNGACRVRYVLHDWGTSFNGDVTFYNTSSSALNGWSLVFSFPGPQIINNAWNARTSQAGKQVTAINPADYNVSIPAGGSLNCGFSATSTPGTNGIPGTFTLNGSTCAKI